MNIPVIQELAGLIEDMSTEQKTQDIDEWKGILNEVTAFRNALCHLTVTRVCNCTVCLNFVSYKFVILGII